jgi:hypothetical protein
VPRWCFAKRGASHARLDHNNRRVYRAAAGTSVALSGWRSEVPVYPPYPYKAGHYPTADSYYDLPPYAATNPGFYRWRYFMVAQERNRYRYMPHIFRGYGNGDGLK